MPRGDEPLAGAGNPRRSEHDVPVMRRVGSWLVWWVLLMSLWVLIDDTLALAELLAGAAVAAMAAFLVEAVAHGFVVAGIAMLLALGPCIVVVVRDELMAAVAAYELASAIAVMVFVCLSQGFGRSGEFELAVVLAVLMYASGLVFVRALERGL